MEISIEDKVVIVDDEDAPLILRHKLSINSSGYCHIRAMDGKTISLHRLVFGHLDPGFVIDHINRNRLDNRKSNLRKATKSQNGQNSKRKHGDGFLGVRKLKHGYQFYIASNNITYFVGKYNTDLEAAIARDSACLFLHGDFAVLNFPDQKPVPMHPDCHLQYCKSIKPTRQELSARNWNKSKANNPGVKMGIKRDSRNGNYVAYSQSFDDLDGLYIGTFKTEAEAMEARDSVSKYFLGDRAALNFPDRDIEPRPVEYWRAKCRNVKGKYVGVLNSKNGKSFTSVYYPGNNTIYLGQFDSKELAAEARDAAMLFSYPEISRYKLNFPEVYTVPCKPEILRSYSLKNTSGNVEVT